jgi:3-dehydroquinate synthase
VGLGARAYDVVVGPGLLPGAGQAIAPFAPSRRCIVIADEAVAALHGATLAAGLEHAGLRAITIQLPAGEQAKSWAGLGALLDRLLAERLERRDLIVAFGGGVIGDLAGFAAAIAVRGIDFVQIPTTLLAQVDSSVGGKTGVNMAAGKNMVGAFHQPRLVLADTTVLDTLPRRELLAGYAEVVKYGALGDAGFFAWLEANGADVLDGAGAARAHEIGRAHV